VSDLSKEQQLALSTAQVLLEVRHPREAVLQNPAIPTNLREWVDEQLAKEDNRTFERARVIRSGDRRSATGRSEYRPY
jgi:hypothetical protein